MVFAPPAEITVMIRQAAGSSSADPFQTAHAALTRTAFDLFTQIIVPPENHPAYESLNETVSIWIIPVLLFFFS